MHNPATVIHPHHSDSKITTRTHLQVRRRHSRPLTSARRTRRSPRYHKRQPTPNRIPTIWDHWKSYGSTKTIYPTRTTQFTMEHLDRIPYKDEHNHRISIKQEREEQYVCNTFIQPDNTVLELGGRYGVVSSVINHKLECPTHHVVVEPDPSVFECLCKNKRTHHCHYRVVQGVVSNTPKYLNQNGYATRTLNTPIAPLANAADTPAIPIYTVNDIQEKYNLRFDTLVADCEGCLCDFVKENRKFVTTQLRNIMFEADVPKACDYGMIRSVLRRAGFRQIIGGFVSFWRK